MTTALLMIDAQRNMLEPPEPVPDAENMRRRLQELLTAARAAHAVVVHVQNDGGADDPDRPGTDGWELMFAALPGEQIVRKTAPNVFESNPHLIEQLRSRGVGRLVIAGMQSEWCIEASARAGLQAGFDIDLVEDAHATYDTATDSAAHTARTVAADLHQEGVRLVPTANVVYR